MQQQMSRLWLVSEPHKAREQLNSFSFHIGWLPLVCAHGNGFISDVELKRDQTVCKNANVGKHGTSSSNYRWADDDAEDPLLLYDPWAKYASSTAGGQLPSSHVGELQRSVTSIDGVDDCLENVAQVAAARAATSSGAGCVDPKPLIKDYILELEGRAANLESLVSAQNSTIAILLQTVENFKISVPGSLSGAAGASTPSGAHDGVVPSLCHRVDALEAQNKTSSKALMSLSTSLASAVTASVELRTQDLVRKDSFIELAKTAVSRDMLQEVLSAAGAEQMGKFGEITQSTAAKLVEGVEKIVRKLDENFSSQLAELVQRISVLEKAPGISNAPQLCPEHSPTTMAGAEPDCPQHNPGSPLDVDSPYQLVFCSSPIDHITTFPWARLDGLKTKSLNGKVGAISHYDDEKQRYASTVHGELMPKAIKAANLIPYVFPVATSVTNVAKM